MKKTLVKLIKKPNESCCEIKPVVAGFVLICIIFLLVGMYLFLALNKMEEFTTVIYRHPLEVSNASLMANMEIIKIHRSMKDVVLRDEHLPLEEAVRRVDEAEKKVFQNLDLVKDKILGETGRQHEKETRKLFMQGRKIRAEVIGLMKNNEIEKAIHLTQSKEAKHVDDVEESMLRLTSYARKKADFFNVRTLEAKKRVSTASILLVFAGIMISLFIGVIVIRNLRKAKSTHEEYEKALSFSEDRYRSLVEQSLAGIYVIFDKKLVYVNEHFCQIFGYSENELLEKIGLEDLFLEEDLEMVRDKILQRMDGRITKVKYNARGRHKDGSVVWLEIHGGTVLFEKSKAVTGMLIDITERILTDKKLIEQAETLKEMSSIGKIGAWEFDSATGKGTWTDETAKIHDLDPAAETDGIIGLDHYHGEMRQKIESANRQAIEKETPYDLELEITTGKGNHKWVRTIARPVIMNNSVVHLKGTLQDITDIKEAQKELRLYQEKLEDMVEERTEDLQKVINSMAGREVKMTNLKKYISALQEQLVQAGQIPLTEETIKQHRGKR